MYCTRPFIWTLWNLAQICPSCGVQFCTRCFPKVGKRCEAETWVENRSIKRGGTRHTPCSRYLIMVEKSTVLQLHRGRHGEYFHRFIVNRVVIVLFGTMC